jgi:putative zinc finger protein
MNCGQIEILLCDYLDGTLPAPERAEFERHLAGCSACTELARDAGAAVAFMDRAAAVDAPPELLTRILAATRDAEPSALSRILGLGRLRSSVGRWFAPLLEPRLVMGMALTVLSFSMMAKCAGVPVRQLKPSDLSPANVYASAEDRISRGWDRTVKFYENLRFVYDVQSRLRQWTEQQEEEDRNASAKKPVEDHRLPAGASAPPAAGKPAGTQKGPSGEK